jgi:carboxylesterase type B
MSLYPTTPALGCPYNTGTFKFSQGALDKMACSIFGDLVQIGPARLIAQTLAKDKVPVYRYRFNHMSFNSSTILRGISTGVEEQFVFSNLIANYPWDMNMAYQVTSAWVSFAHSLNPNVGQGKASVQILSLLIGVVANAGRLHTATLARVWEGG